MTDAIKLKVLSQFPARLIGRAGIDVTKNSGDYYLDLDYNDFPVIGALPSSVTYTLIFDPLTGRYAQLPVSLIGTGGAVPEAPNDGVQYGRKSLAWTPIVASVPATATPLVESGAGAVGASVKYAREDHVHPLGVQPATATPLVESGAGAVGASAKYAREDHVHPATAGGGGVTGPGVAVLGNMAFWTNTGATALGAAPTVQAGNPANAALYSQVAWPATRTIVNNALQVSLGAPIPAGQQEGYNLAASPDQQAIVGTVNIPAGDTACHQSNGVAGYAITNQPTGGGGAVAVGVFGQGAMTVPNCSVFGGNTIVQNSDGGAPGGVQNPGYDANFIAGFEIDVNIFKKAGSVEPLITNCFGLGIAGGGTSAQDLGDALNINMLGVSTGARWTNGLRTFAGACVNGINLGAARPGVNQNSQPIILSALDAGGGPKNAVVYADISGAFNFNAPLVLNAPNTGVPDLDVSGRLLSIPAGGNAIVAGNMTGLLYVHEGTSTGQIGLYLIGTFGGGFVVINQGANWSNTGVPASGSFGIGYDGTNNVWRIYNGAGATRNFHHFFLRIQ